MGLQNVSLQQKAHCNPICTQCSQFKFFHNKNRCQFFHVASFPSPLTFIWHCGFAFFVHNVLTVLHDQVQGQWNTMYHSHMSLLTRCTFLTLSIEVFNSWCYAWFCASKLVDVPQWHYFPIVLENMIFWNEYDKLAYRSLSCPFY